MSTDRTTEILNLLSAMSREIGAFRAEVNARFDKLEARVADLETDVREIRADIRKMNRHFGVFAKDFVELRAYQLDLEARTEVLERKAGITDSV